MKVREQPEGKKVDPLIVVVFFFNKNRKTFAQKFPIAQKRLV